MVYSLADYPWYFEVRYRPWALGESRLSKLGAFTYVSLVYYLDWSTPHHTTSLYHDHLQLSLPLLFHLFAGFSPYAPLRTPTVFLAILSYLYTETSLLYIHTRLLWTPFGISDLPVALARWRAVPPRSL